MSEPGVIVRVLRAQVRPGRVGVFNVVFRRQMALLRAQPGLVYAKLARRLEADGGQEAVLFEEWADAASLYAWVGPDLSAPRLVPGARELIDELSVSHYEILSDDGFAATVMAGFDAEGAGGGKGADIAESLDAEGNSA